MVMCLMGISGRAYVERKAGLKIRLSRKAIMSRSTTYQYLPNLGRLTCLFEEELEVFIGLIGTGETLFLLEESCGDLNVTGFIRGKGTQ